MKKLIKENFDSLNLFNELKLLTETQINAIANGINWTIQNYSNAVLIGGSAVVYYLNKKRPLTPDIDFLVEDIELLKSKLDDVDILYRANRSGNIGLLGISVEEFNADYLDSNVGNVNLNKLILKTFRNSKINNVNVRIINPELLAIMKIELGREKDMQDGFALFQSGLLNKESYLKYINILKNNLNDYESLLSYAEMLK